jgi:hypothetical protein
MRALDIVLKEVAGLSITTFQRKKHTQDETEAEKSNMKSLSEKQKPESDEGVS